MNIRSFLNDRVKQAMKKAGIPAEFDAHLTQSKNPQFGDYQANGAMAAAKALKSKPRDIAQTIVNALEIDDVAERAEIAGPGFINIYLKSNWLSEQIQTANSDDRLGVPAKRISETVVIDYSGPNLAKEMHVGHLRSTIIGDATARVLDFIGDKVIRQNHVGDWGTQFGMLIAALEDSMKDGTQPSFALKDLEVFYQQAKKIFDEDESFAERARNYVVKLQSGDEHVLSLWKKFRKVSLSHSEEIYEKLNVSLSSKDTHGESAYNDDLPILVKELKDKNLAAEDQGAQVVFLQELADKKGNPSPVIVQKKDGGFLYATTDLASLRYRVNSLNADRILYFIDDRQSLHMKQVFTLAKKAGFVSEKIHLEHHAFGKMLGKDGKPFKTRTGGTVKLAELLDEAVERAESVVREKNPDLSEEQTKVVAQKVGIGAVKYADLSKTRTTDYIFDWEQMLSFEGNTGPYMQYAYARICSIFRKAEINMDDFESAIILNTEQEKTLALKTLQLSETIEQVAQDAYPHTLCTYLYEIASNFMTFYEACPILKSDVEKETKASRLMLSKHTAQTIQHGLDLLGIEVMERM